MCNTPVEVQFTSAGCLNYPCRTPTEATLLAYGFTISTLAGLVLDGFATATPEIEQAGGRAIKVVRVRITDAGRRAIAG
jgi:hypothetical protein